MRTGVRERETQSEWPSFSIIMIIGILKDETVHLDFSFCHPMLVSITLAKSTYYQNAECADESPNANVQNITYFSEIECNMWKHNGYN